MEGISLNSDISILKGVGEQRLLRLHKLSIYTLKDLIEHFPKDYYNREITSICKTKYLEENTILATIIDVLEDSEINGKVITKIIAADDMGDIIEIAWFNQPYLKYQLKLGTKWIFTGKVKGFARKKIMECKDLEAPGKDVKMSEIIPVYNSTYKLSQKYIRSLIHSALHLVYKQLEEILPKEIRAKYCLCSKVFATIKAHFPEDKEVLSVALNRLAFEELLLMQLALIRQKGRIKTKRNSVEITDFEYNKLLKLISFEMTKAQVKVINEMCLDIKKGFVLNRLLQGDVGCGKTFVAIVMCYLAIKNGGQAALMAPTEILAHQHFNSFSELFNLLGIETVLLSGGLKKKEKEAAYEKIESGQAQMILGTHALIQQNVSFKNLTLAITDEQHRFGVRQRLALIDKGKTPNVIAMSATPIPRTLALVLYGDMDISIINEMPKGRQKVDTYAVTSAERQRVYNFIEKQVSQGRQAYVICPSIEANTKEEANENREQSGYSEEPSLQSVLEYTQKLKKIFHNRSVQHLHGKMKEKEKQEVMQAFVDGEIQILVSTTVVEVGVNVKNATIIVIEDAERFGLSQLHQLRGRVGRGNEKSFCILITDSMSNICRQRMRALTKTNDGFKLSELDLELRGAGDFFGTRQHGLPELKIANLYRDTEILNLAREAAEFIFNNFINDEKYNKLWSAVDKYLELTTG